MKKEIILDEESGQSTVEYALVIAILSILGIVAWRETGVEVIEMFNEVIDYF